MKYEWRSSSDRAIAAQSAHRQCGSCCALSSSRPAVTAVVVVAPIVIAPIVVVPVVPAPVVETCIGRWIPEAHAAVWDFPTVMVKESKWTAGEELSISYAFIARSERADVGTNMRSSQFFEGIRVDMLARRTQYPETMNDASYWHSRSVAAVRSRWLDVIAPECTMLSACYAVIARQHKTGCTDEDLMNMAIASYNHVTYIPDAPSSCSVFAQLSSWKILRHHPRFLPVFPTSPSTRPARPRSSVDVDGVPGAPPAVRSDGVRPS